MGNMKKISIIIPCYNVEKYLVECLESILTQSIGMDSLELIVINDASTDHTLSILREYEKKYPEQILLIELDTNQRQGYARNLAMQYASGTYTMFVDSDDALFPNALLECYEILETTGAEVIEFDFARGADMQHLYINGSNDGNIEQYVIHNGEERIQFLATVSTKNAYPCCKMYRTDYLKEKQLYFAEGYAHEDTLFGLMWPLYLNHYISYNKCLYAYRVNENGTMLACKKNDYGQFDRCKVMVMAVQECLKRGLLEKYYHIIESSFLHVYYGDTMYFVLQRFDHLPDEVKEMQKTVKMLFPNYSNNPYINTPDQQGFKEFLRTVEMEMTEELFQVLKRQINS